MEVDSLHLFLDGYYRKLNVRKSLLPKEIAKKILTFYGALNRLGIAFVGHVDAGKSTIIGRLLYEMAYINDKELEKLRKKAHELGKQSFMYAFYLDKQKIERTRGITINWHHTQLFTKIYDYTIIDTPGHRDFIKNTIHGIVQSGYKSMHLLCTQMGHV